MTIMTNPRRRRTRLAYRIGNTGVYRSNTAERTRSRAYMFVADVVAGTMFFTVVMVFVAAVYISAALLML